MSGRCGVVTSECADCTLRLAAVNDNAVRRVVTTDGRNVYCFCEILSCEQTRLEGSRHGRAFDIHGVAPRTRKTRTCPPFRVFGPVRIQQAVEDLRDPSFCAIQGRRMATARECLQARGVAGIGANSRSWCRRRAAKARRSLSCTLVTFTLTRRHLEDDGLREVVNMQIFW